MDWPVVIHGAAGIDEGDEGRKPRTNGGPGVMDGGTAISSQTVRIQNAGQEDAPRIDFQPRSDQWWTHRILRTKRRGKRFAHAKDWERLPRGLRHQGDPLFCTMYDMFHQARALYVCERTCMCVQVSMTLTMSMVTMMVMMTIKDVSDPIDSFKQYIY